MAIVQLFLQFIILAIWLIVIPYCIGLLPARLMARERRSASTILLSGYIIFLAIFEIIAIIVVLKVDYGGLTILMAWFNPVAIALAAFGAALEIVKSKALKQILPVSGAGKKLGALSWEERLGWLLFGFILAFQLYMLFTRASFEGDDSYFVVQAVTAVEQDTLYRREPFTGMSTTLKYRNALATFPIWIAMIAAKTRIHAAIVAHSIVPLVLVPLTYLLYFEIGKSLCRKMKETLPMFMVLMAVFQMFGNVSIFTNETFLMARSWQGKSFGANFIIPAVLWLFLLIGEQQSSEKEKPSKDLVFWLLLAVLSWTAGVASSLVVLLAAALCAVQGLYLSAGSRDFRILLKSALACLPGAAYIMLYVILTR